jgi:hypothetical protein
VSSAPEIAVSTLPGRGLGAACTPSVFARQAPRPSLAAPQSQPSPSATSIRSAFRLQGCFPVSLNTLGFHDRLCQVVGPRPTAALICVRDRQVVRRRFDPAQRCQQSARFVVILMLHRPRQTAAVALHRRARQPRLASASLKVSRLAEAIGFDRRQQFRAASGRGAVAAEAPDAGQFLLTYALTAT